MRQVIDTAPRDGKVVILEDDASGTYDVAQWSIEAGNWIGENGEPSKITPTHWYAMPGDKYALPEDSQVGPLASRRRGYNFFHPFNFFSSDRSAPRQSAAASDAIEHRPVANAVSMNAVVEAQTSPVIAMHTPHTRGRFAASSITVIIIVAALVGMYLLRAEPETRYAGHLDIARSGTAGAKAVDQEIRRPQDSRNVDPVTWDLAPLQRQAEADRANTQMPAGEELAQFKQVAESAAEIRQALQREHDRAEALARELAAARLEIDAHAALSDKEKDEAGPLKQVAESTAAEMRKSLQRERDRAEALAQELATARREIDTHTALLDKEKDEAAQLKQAAASAMEGLRQSLQQEHHRAEALAQELATARREIDTYAALSNKGRDEATKLKLAAESATEGLRQSLQQERNRAEALERELELARGRADPRIAFQPAANSPIVVAAEQHPAAESQGSPEAARLISRASALLRQGDIGAARVVLERAAQTGSAQASFTLAETYDPVILSAWGTYGTRGDTTKAREFYANAYAGGIQEAKDRINALRQ